ncbi:MAG: hypothetical protein P9X24_13830 [Candidatus Hatepunaea meridiana]|nr:hypothetical protein [Candidatus Hatepunaea meridiana]
MRLISIIIVQFAFLPILFTIGTCQVKSDVVGDCDTWLMPSSQLQLYIEGLDDRKGLGRIFVPAMTCGADEPLYAIFKDGELVGEQNTGSSFFVKPGKYLIIFGSGNRDQRIKREIDIQREETVILEPDWCALTIEVIDEMRNYYKQDLQIFRVESAESYGIIPAINPELGEHLQTLLLLPGLYKIIMRGEDFNTYVNFTTLLLEPGSYTPYSIVINSETNDFTGAGILASSAGLIHGRNWSIYGALHGNVILTGANDASSKDIKTNLSIYGQLDNRLLYEKFPHNYLSNNLLEFGILRQEGAKFQKSRDRLRLKNTYVYYLLSWIGGYSRLEATTHLFKTIYRFDESKNVSFLDLSGRLIEEKSNVDEVGLEPVFFPLELKEGLGVNVTPLRTFIARLNLRIGLGYWQTYNSDVYRQNSNIDTLFHRIPDSFPQGMETALVSNLSLLGNLSITTEIDILFPFSKDSDIALDLENFISLRVTKNIAIEHTLRLKRVPELSHTIQEQFISIRLSYFLF